MTKFEKNSTWNGLWNSDCTPQFILCPTATTAGHQSLIGLQSLSDWICIYHFTKGPKNISTAELQFWWFCNKVTGYFWDVLYNKFPSSSVSFTFKRGRKRLVLVINTQTSSWLIAITKCQYNEEHRGWRVLLIDLICRHHKTEQYKIVWPMMNQRWIGTLALNWLSKYHEVIELRRDRVTLIHELNQLYSLGIE